ncbi:YbaB/EbfC family nucleoid-associated protein [Saccharopolyspora taberi]|uniref:YbaB/EbfC family DNA-binding protein n=1 Tax=Saccharopolyspora taberi TaxID=60895 RepID=A0ABN3V716_9PSEU
MPSDHRAEVEQLMADYRRSRERLDETRRELAEITETSASADGAVRVTVGSRGGLLGLDLSDDVYERYRPARLSALIMRLTAEATTAAARRAADALAPIVPEGTDPDLLLGEPRIPVVRNETPRVDDNADDDFSAVDWTRS